MAMFAGPKQKPSNAEVKDDRSPTTEEGHEGDQRSSSSKRHVIIPEVVGRDFDAQKPSAFAKVFDGVMTAIASDPHREKWTSFLGRFGIDFIPLLGPVKKFADARELYRVGLESEARTLCLISLLEGVIDVGEIVGIPITAGGSLLFPDEALTELRNVRETVRRLTGGRVLVPDPLTLAAKLALVVPRFKNGVDRMMNYGLDIPPAQSK